MCALFNLSCSKKTTTIASADDGPDDQWSRGVWLYSSNCAGCHGENGEGRDDRPAIAGPGALPREAAAGSDRTARLDTARDLFLYVRESMPPLDTGCLTDDQYYAVVHYVLKQADITIPGEVSAANAASIKLR